ncbi:hypothetical protein ACWCXX_05150 [Streptomyces sp. NPDC001732]
MIEKLLRAATVAALTALSLTPAGPALADEAPLVPQASPCAAVVAPAGQICVPSPKQCIKAPCPQYALLHILPYHSLPSYEEVMTGQGPRRTL